MGSISATQAWIHSQTPGRLWVGVSTYDLHHDGSGVCHVSALRPLLTNRPAEGLWQFPADSHVVSFLHAKGVSTFTHTHTHM